MAWTQHQPPLAQIKRIARKVLDNKAADYREAEYRDAERFYRRLTRQGVDRPTAMGELATFYWRLSHAVGIMRRQDARKPLAELLTKRMREMVPN